MRAIYIAAIVGAALTTPALAQDGAAGANFTGPRIEAHVGYDNVRVSSVGHAGGVAYGVGAGYDFALGSNGTIAGVEVNADFSSTDREYFGVQLKAKRDLDASVRIGTALGSNGLIYAKVGYANARFSAAGFSANNDGVRAGIGYELALGSNAYGKFEYRYSNYEAGVTRNQGIAGVGLRF